MINLLPPSMDDFNPVGIKRYLYQLVQEIQYALESLSARIKKQEDNSDISASLANTTQKVDEIESIVSAKSGRATFNDTYGGTSNSRSVKWSQFGKVVVVSLYDVQMTTSVTSSTNCAIATGLPKAKYASTSVIARTGTTYYCERVGIEAGSTSLVWWWNTPVLSNTYAMNGQLIYIAE